MKLKGESDKVPAVGDLEQRLETSLLQLSVIAALMDDEHNKTSTILRSVKGTIIDTLRFLNTVKTEDEQ